MKTKMRYITSIVLVLFLWNNISAQTTNFVVTNVNNSGRGSLRQAVINAMTVSAPTTITFNIPATGGNVINLSSEILMSGVFRTITINGYNQGTASNNIILRGSGTQSINCFNDSTVTLTVYGLQFENFSYAIKAFGNATYGTNTFIGGTGTNANVFIKNNVAIGTNGGTTITGNYIGTDKNFTAGVGNTYGIYTTTPYYADYSGNPITVNNNYICSAYVGVYLNPPAGNNPNPLLLMNNNIVGTNNASATRTDLANTYAIFTTRATTNAFLQGNTIAYTTNTSGITFGGFELVNNNFHCNAKPINNLKTPYPLPVITAITPNQNGTVTISGTSNAANDVINIFQKDSSACTTLPCQGFFAGSTTTNTNRQWTITLGLPPGKIISANASLKGTTYTPIGEPMERIAAYQIGSSSLFTTCYTIPCPTVNLSFTTTKNNLCYDNKEGTAQLTISPVGTGGVYSYQIINTATNSVIAKNAITTTVSIGSLAAGTYRAVVTNTSTKCIYTSITITITQPNAPLSTTTCRELTPVSSSTSADAVGQVVVSGGTAPYSLTIVRPTGASFTLGPQTSNTFNIPNLAPGNYTVTAFDNNYANGNPKTACTATCSFTINTVNCRALALSVKTVSNVLCNGNATGSVVVKYADLLNNLPLTLTASNGFSQTITTFTSDSTAIIANLRAGSYTITLRNRLNCTTTTSVTITEPPLLSIVCDTVIHAKRVGEASGRAKVSINGGQASYSVFITGPLSKNYTSRLPTQIDVDSLTKGNYIATVIDAFQCSDTCQFTILEPICTGFNVVSATDSIRCFGERNGRITLTNNGISPLTYTWSDTAIGNRAIAENLNVGTYRATITDDRNCKDTITATVSTPSVLTTNIGKTDVTSIGLSNGRIIVSVAGGTASYEVILTQGTTTIPLTSQVGNIFTFNNLPNGTYIATTIDAHECTKIDTIRINNPNCNFVIAGRVDSVSCFLGNNGRIVITHNNPTVAVNFAWSQTGIGNTATATGLRAGIYSVTATTSQNCSDTLTLTVFQPDSLAVGAFPNDVTTIGGSDGRIDVTVSGGSQPYRVTLGTTTATRISATSFVFNGLPKGTYTFTVTDAKGCVASQTVTINEPVCNMTAQINIAQAVSCFGASDGGLSVNVLNAQTPQYNWLPNIGNTATPTGLAAGTYNLTVTDARRCSATAQINLPQPAQISAAMLGDTSICTGQVAKLRFSVLNATTFTLTFTNGIDTFRTNTLEANVTPTTTTTYRLLQVQSGVCTGVIVNNNPITVAVNTPSVPTGFRAEKDSLCAGSEIRLSVTASNATQYIWQTPNGDRTTTVPQLIVANATLANSGNYAVRTSQNGCLSVATPYITVRVFDVSNEKANAGTDKLVCDQTQTTLSATAIINQGISGRWMALNSGILAAPTSPVTSVSNLSAGIHRFIWILTSPICGEVSRDTVAVTVSAKPELANTQTINIDSNLPKALINILKLLKDKTIDPSVYTLKILKSPDKARINVQDNDIDFDRNELIDAQTIEIEFEICSKICPSVCSKGKLEIVLQALADETNIFVPKVFSINNRSGSALEINGLDFYLESEITIVNRWGATVFGPTKYEKNNPEKAWDGKKNGKALPTGAYYYFISYKDKEILKYKKGIIYLVEE